MGPMALFPNRPLFIFCANFWMLHGKVSELKTQSVSKYLDDTSTVRPAAQAKISLLSSFARGMSLYSCLHFGIIGH